MHKYLPSPPVFKLFLFSGIVWAAVVGPLSAVLILKSFGVSSSFIGIFSAICAVISIVCQPLWGLLGDKLASPRKVLCFCLGSSAIFFGCVFLTDNLYIAAALMILDVVFRCSVIGLLDSHTLTEVNVIPGLQYSHIRMAGSVSFGVLSLINSSIINARGIMAIIPLSFCLAVLAVGWGLFAAKGQGEVCKIAAVQKEKSHLIKDAASLLSDKRYIVFIIFSALFAMSTQPLFHFLVYYVMEAGGRMGDAPMVQALRCAVELPLFIFIGYLGKRLSAKKLMLAGVFFTFFYITGLLFANSLFWLVICHFAGAAGFILCLAGRMRYVYDIAPESVRSTSVTVMTACELGVGGAAGNLAGGFILEIYGTQALTLAALAALLAAALVLMGIKKSTNYTN